MSLENSAFQSIWARPVLLRDELAWSSGQKLVTARPGKAADRGGVQRLHFSHEGVIRRAGQ